MRIRLESMKTKLINIKKKTQKYKTQKHRALKFFNCASLKEY